MTPTTLRTKMKILQRLYPRMWMRDGAEFDSRHAGAIWVSAESSEFDSEIEGIGKIETRMFDHYNDQYIFGVNPEVNKTLEQLGLWAEFYDAGTVFIYKN